MHLYIVKQHERKARESLLGQEFRAAVDEINLGLDPTSQIWYVYIHSYV